ncbi:MAG: entericidin A/B family lipoprotein [Alphaproteobacteria bacterium]|nr:entericidin A/B family lipoprotein [Alphaproteobacteria bacterium]
MTRTTILLLAATLTLLAACETVEGLGRDTQKLGNNITGAAKSTK